MSGPFKQKGWEAYTKVKNKPIKPSTYKPETIGDKDEFEGMTREEAKKTIKFNTSNQTEVKRKRAFYNKYGTLNE